MEMFSLKNKVAVISGGAGLYGKQLVRALAMGGAKVYMASRNIEKNKEGSGENCKCIGKLSSSRKKSVCILGNQDQMTRH
jgi:NAD(P)-dependent dehydrogenase (short-subunit alcohol dehydrogenase family)